LSNAVAVIEARGYDACYLWMYIIAAVQPLWLNVR